MDTMVLNVQKFAARTAIGHYASRKMEHVHMDVSEISGARLAQKVREEL